LRSVTPHVFALESLSFLFSRRPLRCDGGPNDPKARSRRRPTERAGRHLEPCARPNNFCNCIQRTLASTSGPSSRPGWCSHLRVSPRRELAPANARRRTMCHRPVRRPDTHFLRMGREGAHGSESRAEGLESRSRGSRFLTRPSGHRSRRSESTCRVAFPSPFLFLSPSTSLSSARFRIRSWSARPNSVNRRRLPVSAFTFSTAPTAFPDPFEPREV